jgi:FlaA1/EpsC-like NDP-sugar epimerase
MNKVATAICSISENIIRRHRRAVVILVHFIHIVLANILAFLIRFESVAPEYFEMMLLYLPVLAVIRLVFYLGAGVYKDIWSFSSINDMIKIIKSATFGSIVFVVLVSFIVGDMSYPKSIYILDWLLLIIISGGTRLIIRVFREYLLPNSHSRKILIVGAGRAGEIIARDIINNPKSVYHPIGFIDDDPYKKGLTMRGVPIFGPISMIPYLIERYKPEEILIAMPSADNSNIQKIYELSKPYNIPIKKLPGINDLLEGNVATSKKLGQRLIDADLVPPEKVKEALELQKNEGGRLGSKLIKIGCISEERLISFLNKQFGISHMKPISLEDLLQREPVRSDIKTVKDFIEGKAVIVTGAGGSIGSELCRQIMKYRPANLILFDRYENNLFKIDLELRQSGIYDDKKITSVIGDILDISRLEYLFEKYRPQIVFHAAAHKHVPLMEFNPVEAVKNNILGTKRLLDTAERYDAENFVMISTDKAVNPTNVMGATKRVAEFLTICMNDACSTKLTTVRFGNVLGSNGSVVTIFKQQMRNGGPLTVTHPEIKRFFMLIPEAVQLVLLAASAGNGGEIFVLDMGKQIKIVNLAENLIRLSGFTPYNEIKIDFTGLRPGEKLYEELFDESEKIIPTINKKFRIAIPELPSRDFLLECLTELEQVARTNDIEKIVPIIQKIVPGFRHKLITDVEMRMA